MRRVLLPLALLVSGLAGAVASPAQITVRGQVELPDGSPAAGVEVRMLPQTSSYQFYRLVAEGKLHPPPVDRAITREDGSYELRAPEAGMWHLYLAPDGYRPMEFNFWPLLEDIQVPELELVAETSVRVRVIDPSGQPVAGALVRAKPPPQNRRRFAREFWRPAYRQAFADEQGRARIARGLEEAVDIYAFASGFYEVESPSVQSGSVELQLVEGAPHELRIETPQGAAVEGALVRLAERRWPVGWTDEEGKITVFLAEGSEPKLHVLAEDGRRLTGRVRATDWPVDGPLELTLEPRELYSGRLVDAETQAPLAGGFAWNAGHPVDFVRTDSTGGYEIPIDGGDNTWIWGAARGYLNKAEQVGTETQAAPTLALQPTVQIHGQVVDEANEPVPGAVVSPAVDMGTRGRRWSSAGWLTPAVSDAQGRFILSRLDPEVGYTVQAVKEGFAPSEVSLPNLRVEARDGLRIVLEAGRTLIGSVVDESGVPVVGARIEVGETPSTTNPRRYFMQQALGQKEPTESFSDEEGRFVVWDLPAGLFELRVTASGYAPRELATLELPELATETDVGEIVLAPGFAIEGRVTDARGGALEGAKVFATTRIDNTRFFIGGLPNDEEEPAAITDVNGFFTVADRAEGEKVDLRVQLTGYAQGKLDAVSVPAYQPVAIRLERASSIRGVVVDANGGAVADARISVQVVRQMGMMSSTQSGGRTTSESDGTFVIENVDPGELQLEFHAEGFVRTTISSLVVEPGRDLEDVRAVLERGATILGRISAPNGKPVAHATILTMEGRPGFGSSFHSAASSDGDGRYRLDGVPPGGRTLMVQHEDFKPESRTIEVEAGDNLIDIALERGLTLSGRVVDSSGEPVASADVVLQSTSINYMGNPQVLSDSAGEFRLQGLSEGTYILRAHKEDLASATLENLEVGPAGLTGVEVRMEPGSAIVGRIVGLESGNYSAVQVFAVKPPRGFVPGRVNQDGTYRISDLASGEYSVQAQLESSGLTADGHVSVVAGAPEAVLDLEFERGLALTGVVLRGAEPLGGAPVSMHGLDVSASSSGLTDSEGRFEIQGLEPGRYTLSVHNYQSGLNHREELELQIDRDITIRLETAQLSGYVLDETDSRPVAAATVQLESLQVEASPQDYWFNARATTDSDGYFRFSEASAGSYRLLAEKNGYAPAESTLTVLEGSDQEGLEIRLTPTDGVKVYVFMPDGQPASSFLATVYDTAGNRLTVGSFPADGEGSAVLSLGAGSWDLVVGSGNTAYSEVRVTVPGEPISIALQPEARLQVRVPELEGDAVLGTVTIHDASGRPFRGMQWTRSRNEWPIAQGRAIVGGLAPGSWTVNAATPDGRAWQAQVQLAAGENPELVLN